MTEIVGTTIYMTRGDTLITEVSILKKDGTAYIPSQNDKIIFTVKDSYKSKNYLIRKEISIEDMVLRLNPEDTKDLKMLKEYSYDIELTKEDGTVDTFIHDAKLNIEVEIGD